MAAGADRFCMTVDSADLCWITVCRPVDTLSQKEGVDLTCDVSLVNSSTTLPVRTGLSAHAELAWRVSRWTQNSTFFSFPLVFLSRIRDHRIIGLRSWLAFAKTLTCHVMSYADFHFLLHYSCDHSQPTSQTDRRTDGRTDGRHARSISATCKYHMSQYAKFAFEKRRVGPKWSCRVAQSSEMALFDGPCITPQNLSCIVSEI